MSDGLTDETVAPIRDVLARFPEVESAVRFGSRAKGVHRPGSDVDLARLGDGLDWRLPGRVDDALDDLLLPCRFSVIALDGRTDRGVAEHVARVGVTFYRRVAARSSSRAG